MKLLKTFTNFSLFLLATNFAWAQSKNSIDFDNQAEKSKLKIELKKMQTNEIESINKLKTKDERNFKTEYVHYTFNRFLDEINRNQFVMDTDFNQYLKRIKLNLTKNNPELEKSLILIKNSNNNNAHSYGYNIFTLDLGNLRFAETEDEIAATLAHEFAHQLLRHSENKMTDTYNENKKLKKLLKNPKNFASLTINDSTILKELYKEYSIYRKNEFEADSLGFEIYLKSKYNPNAFVRSFEKMQFLEKEDETILSDSIYKKLFDLEEQKFKDKWLKNSESDLYQGFEFRASINIDSISTHPLTEERINRLKTIMKRHNIPENEKYTPINTSYSDLVTNNLYKIFETNNEIGVGIYNLLHEINLYPERETLRYGQISQFMKTILDARKKYQFNQIVEKVTPDEQSKDYQKFLTFLWNLSNKEIETIANHYEKKASE